MSQETISHRPFVPHLFSGGTHQLAPLPSTYRLTFLTRAEHKPFQHLLRSETGREEDRVREQKKGVGEGL